MCQLLLEIELNCSSRLGRSETEPLHCNGLFQTAMTLSSLQQIVKGFLLPTSLWFNFTYITTLSTRLGNVVCQTHGFIYALELNALSYSKFILCPHLLEAFEVKKNWEAFNWPFRIKASPYVVHNILDRNLALIMKALTSA